MSDQQKKTENGTKGSVRQDVQRLKDKCFRVTEERENLPTTLFWSLFHTELEQIRRKKSRAQLLRRLGLD